MTLDLMTSLPVYFTFLVVKCCVLIKTLVQHLSCLSANLQMKLTVNPAMHCAATFTVYLDLEPAQNMLDLVKCFLA